MNPILILWALAAGVGLAAQSAINARLGGAIGGQPVAASLISFAIGTLALGGLALAVVDWSAISSGANRAPWWSWLGGFIGAGFVLTTVMLAPRLGVANAFFLFVLGQLTAGLLIDGFGLFGLAHRAIAWWKFAGLGLMLGGVALFTFGDRWLSPGGPAQP